MKTLIIARHAKSDWQPGQNDHARTLNQRGQQDASHMGQRLAKRLDKQGVKLDLIISSSAVRAHSTARLLAAELNYPVEHIRIEESLYTSSPQRWKSVIESLSEQQQSVLIVGHNPEISSVASQLNGQYQDMSPGTIVQFDYTDRPWTPLTQAERFIIDSPQQPYAAE